MSTLAAVLADYWRPGWRAGGPIVSLTRLVDRTECETLVLTRDHDLGSREPFPGVEANSWTERDDMTSRVGYLAGWSGLRWAMHELRRLSPVLLHVNSLHSPTFGILPLLATRWGMVSCQLLLITPHGELARSAQEHKRWKKALARPVLRALIPRHALWHASSVQESEDIRRWLKREPTVIVAPDPAPAPVTAPTAGPDLPTVLFASRIHPIKGLDAAIRIMSSMTDPCRFVIAGEPEDARYWAQCQAMLAELPHHIEVQVRGTYAPDEVATLMDQATVLLLPTKGENFGQVIAEALSRGCPVAIPSTTPWRDYVGDAIGCVASDEAVLSDFVAHVLRESREESRVRRAAVLDAYRTWYEAQESSDLYADALQLVGMKP